MIYMIEEEVHPVPSFPPLAIAHPQITTFLGEGASFLNKSVCFLQKIHFSAKLPIFLKKVTDEKLPTFFEKKEVLFSFLKKVPFFLLKCHI